ncbi:hypothetical protein BY996DRAFT_1787838 [Phakopsora pachyrhizi]|uniref:Expressed protein n=1 Tax=Phakopsora pachyrhizi TaxID=170000 RepID=A0AAV0B059_PHAPC|nr:hypothetical protein BY996DRAFT_1787838 [Phakopsora pachyrhizi]CAH7675464.1 expressed protein [Phakopsora pachyrhizi]
MENSPNRDDVLIDSNLDLSDIKSGHYNSSINKNKIQTQCSLFSDCGSATPSGSNGSSPSVPVFNNGPTLPNGLHNHPLSCFTTDSTKPIPAAIGTEIHSRADAITSLNNTETGAVILQPPGQPALRSVSQCPQQTFNNFIPPQTSNLTKPDHTSIHYDCWSSDRNLSSFMSSNMMDSTLRNFNPFLAGSPSPNGDEVENDPFAQLSARSLALMDQPESEVTIYDCEYCDKAYQGKHARSIWRRHLSDKHKIPLATQPRRTRWDNDANRPKTEEERRERTLESKRRWARKNRAAKKAARESHRGENDLNSAFRRVEGKNEASRAASPSRSRAPSPASFNPSVSLRDSSVSGEALSEDQSQSCGGRRVSTQSNYETILSEASINSGQPGSLSHQGFGMPYSFTAYSTMRPIFNGMQYGLEGSNRAELHTIPFNQSPRHRSLPPSYALQSNHDNIQLLQQNRIPQLSSSRDVSIGQLQGGGMKFSGQFDFGFAENFHFHQEQSAYQSYEAKIKRARLSDSLGSISLGLGLDFHQRHSSMESHESLEIPDLSSVSCSALSTQPISGSGISDLELPALQTLPDDKSGASGESLDCEESRSSLSHEKPIEDFSASRAEEDSYNDVEKERPMATVRAATEPQFRPDVHTPARETFFGASSRMNFAQSPVPRPGGNFENPVDIFNSPQNSGADSSFSSTYHNHFAPMSANKRRAATEVCQPLFLNSSGSTSQSISQCLQTPSGFSRFALANGMIPSPGASVVFGSPHSNLSKCLGLAPSGLGGAPDDCLGGLMLGGGSSWELFNYKN